MTPLKTGLLAHFQKKFESKKDDKRMEQKQGLEEE